MQLTAYIDIKTEEKDRPKVRVRVQNAIQHALNSKFEDVEVTVEVDE